MDEKAPETALVPAQTNLQVALRGAVSLWASATTSESERRADLLRDKQRIVLSFFRHTGKLPAEVEPADVQGWLRDLTEKGISAGTTYQHACLLSSFYSWAMKDPEVGQHVRRNPARLARPKAPKPYQTESVKALSDEEVGALVSAVRGRAQAGDLVGKRDFTFAADSSGFATGQFSRWFDAKYGEEKQQHDWVKVHVMCGVKTNIITAVEVTERNAHDSPYFSPLLDATARSGFQMKEVSADKGYDSFNNRRLTLVKGAIPYIPHREFDYNVSEKPELWKRMYYFYKFNESEFKAHYHKRSNVETVFSMIKAKFGERLRSKTHAAQINEVLCKVLCHNLCCLVQSIYELDIEATFESRISVDANVTPI